MFYYPKLASKHSATRGFTLIEILIALFVFSFVSMILVNALSRVIDAQTGTEKNAVRLRQLQMALLVLSRDLEQTVNRAITNATGQEDLPFIGEARSFTFTHAGYADPDAKLAHSVLQRTQYDWAEQTLQRKTWAVLDQAPQSQAHSKNLLSGISAAHFDYLDQENHFHKNWPSEGIKDQVLPRAVRVHLTIANWGKITQLYVIPAQNQKTVSNQ